MWIRIILLVIALFLTDWPGARQHGRKLKGG